MIYFNIAAGFCGVGAVFEAWYKGNYKMAVVYGLYAIATFILSFTK